MKRTAYALQIGYDGLYELAHGFPITCTVTGEMADGTKVWTTERFPGSWFSLHHNGRIWFLILEGVN